MPKKAGTMGLAPSVPAGLPSHLAVMAVMVIIMAALRSAHHAFDAADHATGHSTDHAANRCANRTGGATTFGRSSLATPDNALSQCGEGRRKNDRKAKKAGDDGQPGFHR